MTAALGTVRRPAMTAAVCAVTLIVSVAASASPSLMDLLVRDRPEVEAGQWWRVVTPVLVQPSGWGQLVFNLLGVAVVGAALERRLDRGTWLLVYLVGGWGTTALYLVWHPADTGGGSSAAVAAMIGALAVLALSDARPSHLDWFAQLYSVFFAAYLTALTLGGVLPSVVAGNAALVAFAASRRALDPRTSARVALLVVLVAGVAMSVVRDDHGVGILVGVVLAAAIPRQRRPQPVDAPVS